LNVLNYTVDLWSIWHALGWAAATAALLWTGMPTRKALILVLLGGVCWELVEMFYVEQLLGFREPAWNRWLTDPIADASGALAGLALGPRSGSPGRAR
jgi:hypothetical protein